MLLVPDLPASNTAVRQARSFTYPSLSLPLSPSLVRTLLLKRICRVAKSIRAAQLLDFAYSKVIFWLSTSSCVLLHQYYGHLEKIVLEI
jgi:hypothetical protein